MSIPNTACFNQIPKTINQLCHLIVLINTIVIKTETMNYILFCIASMKISMSMS